VKKYLHTISAFQFFYLVRYSSLILTGIVFAKSGISQSAIGEYETFTFLAGAVSFFWLNGLLKALLPLSADRQGTGESVFSAFILISFFSVLAALFILLLQPFFLKVLLSGKEIPEISLLLAYIIFGIPAGLAEYYYLIKKKDKALFIYAIVSFSVQFLMVVLPVILWHSVSYALAGLVISSLLRYFWLWMMLVRNNEIHFSFSFVKSHLRLGSPLVAAAFLSGSAQFVDGFIITSRYDESVFAIFRYGARELPLATLLANALSTAVLPDFVNRENLHVNLKELKMNILRLTHFLFPLTAVLLILSYPLFPVLFNPKFSESASIFNIYLLLVTSRLLMPQTILTGLKYTRSIMFASFSELIINVALSLLFVDLWGIEGVAYATVIAYLSEKIYLVLVVRRKLGIRLSEYHPVGYFILYSVIIICVFIVAELIFI